MSSPRKKERQCETQELHDISLSTNHACIARSFTDTRCMLSCPRQPCHAMPFAGRGGGLASRTSSSPNPNQEISSQFGPAHAANLPGTLCFSRPLHSPLPACRVPRDMKHPLHPSLCMSAGSLLAYVLFYGGESLAILKLLLDFGCNKALSAYTHAKQLETPFNCEVVCIVVSSAVCEKTQDLNCRIITFCLLSISISSRPFDRTSQSGGNHAPGDIAFDVSNVSCWMEHVLLYCSRHFPE